MKASDVIGRRIVAVHQERVCTRWNPADQTEHGSAWEVTGFVLDNGALVILHAQETDDTPIVTVEVIRRPAQQRIHPRSAR